MKFTAYLGFYRTWSFVFTLATLVGCKTGEKHNDLPVVDLDKAQTREVNLSSLIDSVEVIPLETDDKYLIQEPTVWFTEKFMLVGSRDGKLGARLFMFDLNGKFIREIAPNSYGKGPGEHLGRVPFNVRYYEGDQLIQVNWGGNQGQDPQLFTIAGDFVKDVHVPEVNEIIGGLRFVERWDDNTWFGSAFDIVGPINFNRPDSTLIQFFSSDGQIVKTIPRKIFSKNPSPLAPPPSAIRYDYNHTCKFFVNSLDTLFRIEDMQLIPEVIFKSKDFANYNTATSSEDLNGRVALLSMVEGNNYWLLNQTILSAQSPSETPLVLVNKQSLQATDIQLNDDVFQFFPGSFFSKYLMRSDGRKPFQKNLMYVIIDADEVTALLASKSGDFDSQSKKLTSVKESDNPVIFAFTLKTSLGDL